MGGYDPKAVKDYEADIALERGWYQWKITNVKEDVSKKSQNQMIFVECLCTGGPKQSNGRTPVGQESTLIILIEYDNLDPRGKKMHQKLLMDLITSTGNDPNKKVEWDDLINCEFEGEAKPDEYDGEPQTRITRLRAIPTEDYVNRTGDIEDE
jgi:hypothetical protein